MSEPASPEIVAVRYGEREFTVPVVRTARRTLAITVYPDGTVVARAPRAATSEAITLRIQRRAPWIARQLADLARYEPKTPPRKFMRGESHRYLGRQFMLKIESALKDGVHLHRPYLVVTVRDDASPAKVKELLGKCPQTNAVVPMLRQLRLFFSGGNRFLRGWNYKMTRPFTSNLRKISRK